MKSKKEPRNSWQAIRGAKKRTTDTRKCIPNAPRGQEPSHTVCTRMALQLGVCTQGLLDRKSDTFYNNLCLAHKPCQGRTITGGMI
jgi:hypothetical protein